MEPYHMYNPFNTKDVFPKKHNGEEGSLSSSLIV
jgi:hypothetical protein